MWDLCSPHLSLCRGKGKRDFFLLKWWNFSWMKTLGKPVSFLYTSTEVSKIPQHFHFFYFYKRCDILSAWETKYTCKQNIYFLSLYKFKICPRRIYWITGLLKIQKVTKDKNIRGLLGKAKNQFSPQYYDVRHQPKNWQIGPKDGKSCSTFAKQQLAFSICCSWDSEDNIKPLVFTEIERSF